MSNGCFLASLLLATAARGAAVKGDWAQAPSGDAFAAQLTQRALAFFLAHTNPVTGLVRDRARAFGPTPDTDFYRRGSVAATGFGMAVLANAAHRGLVAPKLAEDLVRRALTTADQALGKQGGWLYHFVDWKTGARFPDSEVSTVDTSWFLAGALYAAALTPDSGIKALADKLYRQLDFTAMRTDGGARPDELQLTMGWSPERGYFPERWNSYAEHLVLLLLGLGHPLDPLPPASWCAFARPRTRVATGADLVGADLPLFVHQYPHLFVDFRGFPDPAGDLAVNAAEATRYNRAVCAADTGSATFRAGYWGLSASDGPDGYLAFSPTRKDGTVCAGCAGASAMFDPAVLDDLAGWAVGPQAAQIYGAYGFVDGFNLDRAWVDVDTLGITAGALYLALANRRPETSVAAVFSALPPVAAGLAAARGACPSAGGS